MIQYWSQGEPPQDVRFILAKWKHLMESEKLGEIRLFDRQTADTWIRDNAPEFHEFFANAFHYAMESDIFRIAYASKLPCIYVDADCWPLEHTASTIRYAIQNAGGMLYFRSHRPWINNCFMVSHPDWLFIKELSKQCLGIDLRNYPKDRSAILETFGPTRYNKVVLDLIQRAQDIEVSKTDVPGCSRISLDKMPIYFTHEFAVASGKPPFKLAYKAPDANWRNVRVLR